MRKLFCVLLVSAFIGISSCEMNNPEINNENPGLPPLDTFIVNNYLKDAKSLYFQEIISDSSHPNFNNPILDTTELTKILRIIEAVYNLKSEESDTVFNYYKIHRFYYYKFDRVYLWVNPDLGEIKNLSNSIIPTGESNLDNLLTTFEFDSVQTHYGYPNHPWLTIYSKNEYNLIPIEKAFNDLPQITIAEMDSYFGDGDNIELSRINDTATITFSIGKGDCWAGCIYHKYWQFKVIKDSAEFIKTY